MKRSSGVIVIGAIGIATLIVGSYALFSSMHGATVKAQAVSLFTNNSFIDGLYLDADLNDPKGVFRLVFNSLPREVTVYPSENYYYFQMQIHGRILFGSIGLLAHKIDQGIVQFGYAEKPEQRTRQKYFRMAGNSYVMTPNDSMTVKRINNWRYEVSYDNRTVAFNFHRDSVITPKKAKLTPDEVCVGPSFDESGLRFFLIFNNKTRNLFWIINEDGFTPEEFKPAFPGSTILIGDRTEFAFYNDSINNRKIMVGVNGENVLHNNWYDGPFDQMPDNYVKEGVVRVEQYLNAHYHYPAGQIDKYGHLTGKESARTPVAPYMVYFKTDDLRPIDSLSRAIAERDQMIKRITIQRYDVPKDYFADVIKK